MGNQHNLDEYELPRLQNYEAPDRFDKLDAILDKAHREGVVASLPSSEQEVRTRELNESRICTIRTRLYLLGYLKRDNHSPEIGSKLKKAIYQFQSDAGLTKDSWVGRQTWTALQELVSFEHPSNLSKWLQSGPIKPALLRAIKLRLFVLGLLPTKQAQDPYKLQKALDQFVLVAKILGLHDKSLSPRLAFETINVLFDQDSITAHLGKVGEDFLRNCPPEIPGKIAQRSIHKFVVCCAKVELWLLGYDVPLDGIAKFKSPRGSEVFSYLPARFPLYHALYTFWRDSGLRRKNARKQATSITGLFFVRLADAQEDGEFLADPNLSDQLYEMLVTEKKEVIEKIWEQIKAIGSRIWDGIKRVWRWFKSMFKRAYTKISTWAKNVARLSYQYALNVFPVVTRIAEITKSTVNILIHKTFAGSDVRCIVINRDRDFDYRIYVNSEGEYEEMKAIVKNFSTKVKFFNTGMRVLSLMVNSLIAVISSAPMAGGWFGLILVLLKIYSRLKSLGGILEEEQAFLAVA